MVRFVRFDLLAASGTPEHVVAGVGITETDLHFQIPIAAQDPSVTVGCSRTDEPALVADVLQFARIGAQEADPTVESSDVILSSMRVYADEMSGKTVAEPVSGFGLRRPMLPPPVVRQRPGIDVAPKIKCPFGSETYLHPEIDIQESVGKQVGLHCRLLRPKLL